MKLTKEQKREARKERKAKRQGLFAEFKKFVMRGNMVDMAVGVMVASAFSKIVTTLTNSIFMPWITWMLSGVSVEDIKTVLKPEELNDAGEVIAAEIAINWGAFIQYESLRDVMICFCPINIRCDGIFGTSWEPSPTKNAAKPLITARSAS